MDFVRSVAQVVSDNSEMPQLSVVDMMQQIKNRIGESKPNILNGNHDLETVETKQENTYRESEGNVFFTDSPSDLYVEPCVNTQIQNVVAQTNLDNTVPEVVGVPGAVLFDFNPPTYDRFILTQEYLANQRYFGQTLPAMTTVGLVSAVVIYMCLSKSNSRTAMRNFFDVL